VLVAAIGLPATVVLAQGSALPLPITPGANVTAPPADAPAPAPTAAPTVPTAVGATEMLAARGLARVALVDLRAVTSPTPADYAIAAELLSGAAKLDPSNADVARLWLAAAQESGDASRVLAAARAVAVLDPKDTSAQWQLIEARAALGETAEGRLAVYEQVLGPRGEGVDPSVRSRVAFQSALVKRQRGDLKGFGQDLARAAQLDSTNKAAAAMLLELFVERVNEPVGRVELLTNLLLADPLEERTLITLAEEFGAAGATEQSLRFFAAAERVMARDNRGLDAPSRASKLIQRGIALGTTDDPRAASLRAVNAVATELTNQVDEARRQAQLALDAAKAANQPPPSDIPALASIRLPLELERVRLAAALAAGNAQTVRSAVTDSAANVADLVASDASDDVKLAARAELTFIRLWAGLDLEQAVADLATLRAQGLEPSAAERLGAMVQHRSGQTQEARAVLAAAAKGEKPDPLAALALAQLELDDGAKAEVVEPLLLTTMSFGPGTPPALWAHAKHVALTGKAPPAPPLAQRFTELGQGIPAWVDDVTRDPARFVTINATADRSALDLGEASLMTVRVRNALPVPVAIGPGEAVDSRVLLNPTVDSVRGADLDRSVPEIINIDRRLRLMPREEMAARFWPEPGVGGWTLDGSVETPVRVRWRVANGFELVGGSPVVRQFGGTFELNAVTREGVGLIDAGALAGSLQGVTGPELAKALLRVRFALLNTRGRDAGTNQFNAADAARLVQSVTDRYRSETAGGRVLILSHLPSANMASPTRSFDAALRTIEEPDPTVRLALMVTRGGDMIPAPAEGQGRLTLRLRERFSNALGGLSSLAAPMLKISAVQTPPRESPAAPAATPPAPAPAIAPPTAPTSAPPTAPPTPPVAPPNPNPAPAPGGGK
jgi:tetratricopeptide (TPR) repeat protein